MSKSLKKLIDINRLREFKNKLVGTDSPCVQTGAVDQTVAGKKTFSKPIVGSVTGSSGSCTGNAATATTATTAKSCTGNAATATTATTAKSCTGNAATATQFSANATVALTGDATGTSAGSKKGWSVPVTLANSGVTAGTYGPSADVTGNNNATISVPEITVDAKGRVTSVVNRTLTCKNDTYKVYNKTLTIQKNGTNVATFTSNSNTDVAANITVPTKVSELTNDSGFLTSHQSLSNYVTLNGAQTISGAKTFTGNIIGINKDKSTEDANSLYSTTAGSKLTYYTTSGGVTTLTNVPAPVNTTLESRTLRRFSNSDWVVEQICHNNNGLYYRKGMNGTWGAWKTFAFTDSNISGNAATATTATTAKACTGNAATATKLAAKRTIALSGAATGTATGFDGSGNITIPVTALAASAIRAQWYAAYPDGPEAHNAMWGGRDITAAFDAGTVSANIANGTFRDIFPGDYITKQVTISGTTYTVKWVIADCDYWINKGDAATTAMTTHHVAIVPQVPIFSARMNPTNTTEGGYAGSEMYRNVIPACATGIVSAFGSSHILTFRDYLTQDLNASAVSSGITTFTGAPSQNCEWYSQQCNLMSEAMVYDGPHCASSAFDNITATRQMSAFRLSERLINHNHHNQWWWLRDVVSSALFADVSGFGRAGTSLASVVYGVRPFALLR